MLIITNIRYACQYQVISTSSDIYTFVTVLITVSSDFFFFYSRIFDFRIISEFLNSRKSTTVVNKAYSNSLLARTLFSQGDKFANIMLALRISGVLTLQRSGKNKKHNRQ